MRIIFDSYLRPPGAVAEAEFVKRCIRCGKCLEVCPYGTLKMGSGFSRAKRVPYFIPSEVPCYLCMRCPEVCPTGALDVLLQDFNLAHIGRAHIIRNKCYNYINSDIFCMTCYDRCPLRASGIILHNGITPAITTNCVGCGVCEYVCPKKAITVLSKNAHWIPADAVPIIKVPPPEIY